MFLSFFAKNTFVFVGALGKNGSHDPQKNLLKPALVLKSQNAISFVQNKHTPQILNLTPVWSLLFGFLSSNAFTDFCSFRILMSALNFKNELSGRCKGADSKALWFRASFRT